MNQGLNNEHHVNYIVLRCVASCGLVLHRIALHGTALHCRLHRACSGLYWLVILCCILFYCLGLPCLALHCLACIALHGVESRGVALHYIACMFASMYASNSCV